MKKFIFILLMFSLLLIPRVYAKEVLTNVYQLEEFNNSCFIDVNTSNDVRVMQGAVFFNKNKNDYVVYCGYSADDKEAILTLVDLNTCEVLDKNSERILGHCNDLTYNKNEDKFYAMTYPAKYNNKWYIEEFEIKNNKINYTRTITSPVAITSGFGSYHDFNDPLKFLAASGGNIYDLSGSITNDNVALKNNKKINVISTTKTNSYYDEVIFEPNNIINGLTKIVYHFTPNDSEGYSKFVNQGGTYYNNNYYFARAINGTNASDRKTSTKCTYYTEDNAEYEGYDKDSSFIMVYNAKTGNYKYSLYVPNTIFESHFEGLSVIDGDLYMGLNNHSVTPKQVSFLKYENIDIYEDKYQENHKISVKDKSNYIKDDNKMVISGIINNNVNSILENVTAVNGKHKHIIGVDNNKKTDKAATGDRIRVIFNENEEELFDIVDYKLSIKGDVNSDGLINVDDVLMMAEHIIDTDIITEDENLLAADYYDDDNQIKINDVIKLLKDLN